MLRSLTIVNFALIEHATIEFSEGLNILTGETGAGKSILIDSLSAVTGGRVSQNSIRTGADYFRVEACFDILGRDYIGDLLTEHGIQPEEDGTLIISRQLNRHGKNSITINGFQATLSTLRKIGEKMIDMHGQHENQALLKSDVHLSLLDNYDLGLRQVKEDYQKIYKAWLTVHSELEEAKKNSTDILRRQDMLSWQVQEISAAKLSVKEEEKIEQEVKVLANAEKILNPVSHSYALLNQGQRGAKGIVDSLSEVRRNLESAEKYDDKISAYLEIAADCYYQLEELALELKNYCDDVEFNPDKLAAFEQRLDVIYKLKKKYGASIPDILKYHDEAATELSSIENHEQHIESLEKKRLLLKPELDKLAETLDKLRKKAAGELSKEIAANLTELAMPKAVIQIDVKLLDDFSSNGRNEVVFLFSANPGENVKMLNKIASGGELSRVALAIKAVCAHREQPDVMIFDEIDAGIGGKTAQRVAEKIAALSQGPAQIICITHLPQIACMADSHIHVSKHIAGDRTITLAETLNRENREAEIARMLSGEAVGHSIETAVQMIESAQNKKNLWKNKAQT